MMEKQISYLNRTYSDYKQALIDFSKKYYPDMAFDYDDASVGSWLIDVASVASDELSYHIDRVFQETNINSANNTSSLYALARNNGFKVPGPKGSMAEVNITCLVPAGDDSIGPNYSYAPIVRRGTKMTAGSQTFELLNDVDFSKQFDDDGHSNRTVYPVMNSNGEIIQYRLDKLTTVTAGESKIYKKVVKSKDISPFMEVVLPEKNIMNIESVIVVDGMNIQDVPTYSQFYIHNEKPYCSDSTAGVSNFERFFEVDSLSQQYLWDDVSENGKSVVEKYAYVEGNDVYPVASVTKGEWKKIHNKFITEYTDNGYLKIIFGAGMNPASSTDSILPDDSGISKFSKFQIERVINNESLGYLPKADSTIFVLYRVGGGRASNVAKGAINFISYLNAELNGEDAGIRSAVQRSISVKSTTPSVSGKDMPSADELRYLIKYNNGSQERCVTVKDYISRILMLPPKYGTPFRVGVAEENNKIMVYLLGVDYQGHLDAVLPVTLIDNIKNYLEKYRMITDFIEIKSGKIINLGFDIDVFIDKDYNKQDVIKKIIETVTDYMDINKHNMGDDIFVGDIEKEISKVDGVLNLINVDVWNKYGEGYSSSKTQQEVFPSGDGAFEDKLDLEASDGVIYSEGDSLLEVKYPNKDVRIRTKIR